ncbi:MAG: tetraacyldisaccharide 4'-kinase [Candidatus Cloacimonetes bacterium]|nr:tetraacyldisaccharide 4'-kinase [Candidatus Cloacimonadota bacterium]
MDKHNFATRHLLARSLLSYLLYPASLIYAGYMLFRRKFLFPKPFRAPFKVISIGNIVSGGSGKTPITIALAKALQNHGLKVAVASRAYKAGWENSAAMISDGKRLLTTVANAGDEALMVASALPGIPVYVGRKRKDVLRLIAPSQPDVVSPGRRYATSEGSAGSGYRDFRRQDRLGQWLCDPRRISA